MWSLSYILAQAWRLLVHRFHDHEDAALYTNDFANGEHDGLAKD